MMFAVLPYAAFGIFIVGSIYRYTKKGYKVSSLSSQFIEGKKLFWGSQPFHWGLLILFFGHLIAFLFPSSVIAFNGHPIRLLILEISSFAFGLSALLGLVLLIKRRLTSRNLLVVTNKMDMLVYTVLSIQIVSGLGVAFFVRWGSTWFASVMTPYLRSVFSFSPDIAAISVAPSWVQVHVISAFVIIGVIPFTRFMHFLVAPIDYTWRKYQLVEWNWDRKKIRTSTRHNFGKKPKNH
jgi:nitrate reductase gamma subunit